ncbi:MAG: hypothetical protein JST83_18460 [Bacteroidetes bacterium]|nr:hypothetical protein [Bacteroidota bacterium]
MTMVLLSCEESSCGFDWFKLISLCLPLVLAMIGFLLYSRQLRLSTKENLLKSKYEKTIMALESCWKLLSYTTQTENPCSIIFFEKTDGLILYYLHVENAKKFFAELNEVNYRSGLGLFLSSEIKELLFEYRSIVYGVLLRERNNKENKIVIQNEEMRSKLLTLHNQLLSQIKLELDGIHPNL